MVCCILFCVESPLRDGKSQQNTPQTLIDLKAKATIMSNQIVMKEIKSLKTKVSTF
jgi:hypothetical protein